MSVFKGPRQKSFVATQGAPRAWVTFSPFTNLVSPRTVRGRRSVAVDDPRPSGEGDFERRHEEWRRWRWGVRSMMARGTVVSGECGRSTGKNGKHREQERDGRFPGCDENRVRAGHDGGRRFFLWTLGRSMRRMVWRGVVWRTVWAREFRVCFIQSWENSDDNWRVVRMEGRMSVGWRVMGVFEACLSVGFHVGGWVGRRRVRGMTWEGDRAQEERLWATLFLLLFIIIFR